MKLFSYITVALVATVALSIASPKDEMLSKETAAWQAFKDKKADDFQKLVAANMVGIYAQGVADMAKELSDMQKWDMKSFAISDYNATALGPDVAMASYKVTLEGTMEGKDGSGTYNAGSVWQKKGGEWQAVFHTIVKEDAVTPDAQKKE